MITSAMDASRNAAHRSLSASSVPLTSSNAKLELEVGSVAENSRTRSDNSAPAALSAAPTTGKTTLEQPSRRAIATLFNPAAPPPPTTTALRGSIPWLIVISSIACTIWSVAISEHGERRIR